MKSSSYNIINKTIGREVFDNSMDAILITSPDGRIFNANRSACELLQMTVKEICNAGRDRLVDITDENLASLLGERSLKGKVRGELRFIRKNGTRFTAEVSSAIFKTDDGSERTIMIIRDISLTRLIENDLKKGEANLRSMIESTDSSIWSIDNELRLIVGNTSFLKNFEEGTGRRIGRGDSVLEGLPAKLRDTWTKYYEEGLSGKSFRIETVTVKPLKKKIIRYKFAPIRTSEGRIIGLSVLSQNITDLKRITLRLKKKTIELQDLARRQEAVRESERRKIANDLHDDLGQLLTALNLDISWVKSRIGIQSAVVNEKLADITNSVGVIIGKIRDIASFLHPVELMELGIYDALKMMLEKSSGQAGISFKLNYDKKKPYIDDLISVVLYRVAQEAVTNILKHASASCIDIALMKKERGIEMIISDNGSGISSEVRNSTLSLGLIGMRERVHNIDGQFSVISRQGKGTRIKVIIPNSGNL